MASQDLDGATPHCSVPLGTSRSTSSYGVNYLANVVCAPVGVGSGVLIRALEPLTGVALMRANRGHPNVPDRRLCSGPGRLCRAFGLTRADNDTDLVFGKVRILDDDVVLPVRQRRSGGPFSGARPRLAVLRRGQSERVRTACSHEAQGGYARHRR